MFNQNLNLNLWFTLFVIASIVDGARSVARTYAIVCVLSAEINVQWYECNESKQVPQHINRMLLNLKQNKKIMWTINQSLTMRGRSEVAATAQKDKTHDKLSAESNSNRKMYLMAK